MIEPDQFDEKLAGGGSGPTICSTAFYLAVKSRYRATMAKTTVIIEKSMAPTRLAAKDIASRSFRSCFLSRQNFLSRQKKYACSFCLRRRDGSRTIIQQKMLIPSSAKKPKIASTNDTLRERMAKLSNGGVNRARTNLATTKVSRCEARYLRSGSTICSADVEASRFSLPCGCKNCQAKHCRNQRNAVCQ